VTENVSAAITVFVSTLITLIVIMDPPGAVPIFLALTARMTSAERAAAARRASLVAFGVIALFALFGQRILDYLHVSLAALQGAGGLLLLLVALQLLTGQEQESMADAGVNVAMVPLGTPLLAGPGAIVAMMLAVAAGRRLVGGYRVPRRGAGAARDDGGGLPVPPLRDGRSPGPRRVGHRARHPNRRSAAFGDRSADGRQRGSSLRHPGRLTDPAATG
jgi:MarC family membrane protein